MCRERALELCECVDGGRGSGWVRCSLASSLPVRKNPFPIICSAIKEAREYDS